MAARLTATYNCAHFLCDAWLAETGQDISVVMSCFLADRATRYAGLGLVHTLSRLSAPVGPCIVLWRTKGVAPHVGLYARRTVLHLTEQGPIRQQLVVARLGRDSERYYAPR